VGVPRWTVEISAEVEPWYATLKIRDKIRDKAMADRAFDRPAENGPALRMPHARALGGGLFELRFTCENTARRVTYYCIGPQRKIITLTTFRKQRQQERREIERARRAMVQDQQARAG
jgi:hypothetical protein